MHTSAGNKAADLLLTAIRELALAMLPEQAVDQAMLCMGYIVVPEVSPLCLERIIKEE